MNDQQPSLFAEPRDQEPHDAAMSRFDVAVAGGEIPIGVPYTRGSATSRAAAESVALRVTGLRKRALEEFNRARSTGLTFCDLMDRGFTQSSAATRITELRRAGLIVKTERKRSTPRGGEAFVHVAREFAGDSK